MPSEWFWTYFSIFTVFSIIWVENLRPIIGNYVNPIKYFPTCFYNKKWKSKYDKLRLATVKRWYFSQCLLSYTLKTMPHKIKAQKFIFWNQKRLIKPHSLALIWMLLCLQLCCCLDTYLVVKRRFPLKTEPFFIILPTT